MCSRQPLPRVSGGEIDTLVLYIFPSVYVYSFIPFPPFLLNCDTNQLNPLPQQARRSPLLLPPGVLPQLPGPGAATLQR